jgi:hypothetical protein
MHLVVVQSSAVLHNLSTLSHTKYCLKVMAAHQPHFAYIVGGGGEMVYGIDWPRQLLINRPNQKMFYLKFVIIQLYCHSF